MPDPRNDALRLSDAGAQLIEDFEGYRADWYDDPVGVRTIGIGWTRELPEGFRAPLSRPEARRLLRETIGDYEHAVRRNVDVPLSQPQFDALVSFTYNLGASRLRESTLRKRLNGGDAWGAAAEFDRWVYAGGEVLAGLVRRRAAERALFESGTEARRPGGVLRSLRDWVLRRFR